MIRKFNSESPDIHSSCFIAESSDIIGKVKLAQDVNVWFGAVIRGDLNNISIDEKTNIQDNCVIHVEGNNPASIGKYVTIGHNAIIHGCKIEDYSLIGMGSIIMNNAVIGSETIIGAGSLVTEHKQIPPGVLCMGSPARVIRKLTAEEKQNIKNSAKHYVEISKLYSNSNIDK
ncbi:gamma carbonic anhydrase family protein [Clostridium tyrobutyricum]|uniref:gamma carbonic anhydrase family protein n=1 Tax=Clostridium tyrobutyricum TaxID=1519 RepID=UPI0011C9AA69|nr:gamma carbonic anhydrase family protein [Clostridium tyrobutyricum]